MSRAIRRAALGLALLAAAAPLSAGGRTSISGQILSGPRRGEVVLQRLDRQRHRHREVARFELEGGGLEVAFLQTEPALYRLLLPGKARLDLALRPGQRLVFTYDPARDSFSSSGSADTAELRAGLDFSESWRRRAVAEPERRHAEAMRRGDAAAMAGAERELQRARRAWYEALVDHLAGLDSPLAVYGLYSAYDWNRLIGDHDLAAIEAVHRRLAATDPEAKSVERLADLIRRYRQTAVGAVLPDAPFKDTDGRIIELSHLRGRHVLVELWASWCAPCRRRAAALVRHSEKYGDSGFVIYSVSFDRRRDVWMRAIRRSGLDWPHHVWDLQGRGAEAAYVYATRPPASFLLDPEGRILAKNLSAGMLDRRLRQLFGF